MTPHTSTGVAGGCFDRRGDGHDHARNQLGRLTVDELLLVLRDTFRVRVNPGPPSTSTGGGAPRLSPVEAPRIFEPTAVSSS